MGKILSNVVCDRPLVCTTYLLLSNMLEALCKVLFHPENNVERNCRDRWNEHKRGTKGNANPVIWKRSDMYVRGFTKFGIKVL